MRIAEELTLRFALGATHVCLIGVKPDLLRPNIAGMREGL